MWFDTKLFVWFLCVFACMCMCMCMCMRERERGENALNWIKYYYSLKKERKKNWVLPYAMLWSYKLKEI